MTDLAHDLIKSLRGETVKPKDVDDGCIDLVPAKVRRESK